MDRYLRFGGGCRRHDCRSEDTSSRDLRSRHCFDLSRRSAKCAEPAGAVTRDEARVVIELLLGLRLLGGQPLRLPDTAEMVRARVPMLPSRWHPRGGIALRSGTGQVLNVVHFRQLDADRSGALSAPELGNLGLAGLDAQTVLTTCDANKDGQVSLSEWWRVPIAGAADTKNES